MLVTIHLRSYPDGDAAREERPVLSRVDVEIEDRDFLTVRSAHCGACDIDPDFLEQLAGGREALRQAIERGLGERDAYETAAVSP